VKEKRKKAKEKAKTLFDVSRQRYAADCPERGNPDAG
jgi:hypothetical protein